MSKDELLKNMSDFIYENPALKMEDFIKSLPEEKQKAPRTMRRHLAVNGLSWTKIRNRILIILAKKLLKCLSVKEVAELLGFHDTSSFGKMFFRIEKVRPSIFCEVNNRGKKRCKNIQAPIKN